MHYNAIKASEMLQRLGFYSFLLIFIRLFNINYRLIIELCNLGDNVGAVLESYHSAVKHKMVIFKCSPLTHGEGSVEDSAASVLIRKTLFDLDVGLAVCLEDTARLEIHIRTDKDVEAIVSVAENVIGASAYDNALSFFRKLLDNVYLCYLHAVGY